MAEQQNTKHLLLQEVIKIDVLRGGYMDLIEELEKINEKYEKMNRWQKWIYTFKNSLYMKYLSFKYRKL